MKRISALLVIPAVALALASCGSDGSSSPNHSASATGSPSASSSPSSTAPGTESPAPSSGARTPEPTASGSATPNPEAAVVGQWGGGTDGSPVLWIAESGRFNGNDGCNSFSGTWMVDGASAKLKDLTQTLVGCPGMDTWLSSAAAVQVKDQTLLVTNAEGKEIGTLPRINVAG